MPFALTLLGCNGKRTGRRAAIYKDEGVPELNQTPCQQDVGLGGSRNKVACIFKLFNI
jgi:hypothetical protein